MHFHATGVKIVSDSQQLDVKPNLKCQCEVSKICGYKVMTAHVAPGSFGTYEPVGHDSKTRFLYWRYSSTVVHARGPVHMMRWAR